MKTKVILITGASSGIGFETANYLHQLGHHVIGLSRSYPKKTYHFNYILCDITNEVQVNQIKQKIAKDFGCLDVLVNSAGMGISGAIEHTPLSEVQQIYQVNVFGHFLVTRTLLPLLRQSKDARIINISSIASEIALPFQSFYSMTKASVDAFTKALSIELKPFSIQVGSILPGDIQTNFTKNRLQPAKAEDELYGKRIKASIERMEKDESNGMPAIRIAKKVEKMINKKSMPIRTTVGMTYKLIRLMYRLLPEKWVLFFVRKLYG